MRRSPRAARRRKKARRASAGSGFGCNAELPSDRIAAVCRMEPEAESMLEAAFARLGLTARAYDRIVRVARTIADLDGADTIAAGHVAEAIQYRGLDRLGISG